MPEAATPEVLWAQRSSATDPVNNFVYLTISVPDVTPENLKLDLQEQTLSFAGHSGSLKRDYGLKLTFYGEVDVKDSKINHTAKNVELVLRKKELKEEFWPRLLKDTQKMHWLRTDFDKWVDEDEQNEAPEDDMGAMGGGGMGGMPGMGDMSSMMGGGAGGDFGGIDFSKLGGAGMGGMGDEGEEGEEEGDDNEMPGLEGEEEESAEGGSDKPKIEEVN